MRKLKAVTILLMLLLLLAPFPRQMRAKAAEEHCYLTPVLVYNCWTYPNEWEAHCEWQREMRYVCGDEELDALKFDFGN